MKILSELLKKVEKLDLDNQLKVVCDQIKEDEKENITPENPDGPNIYLSIGVPGITKNDICFLSLERETRGKFITGLWTKQKGRDIPLKRTLVWEIKENSVEKILQFYSEKVSLMRGE